MTENIEVPLHAPFFRRGIIQKNHCGNSAWTSYGKSGTVVVSHRLSRFSIHRALVAVAEVRGADFYRQRADDMRRQADRALSRHLHETYMRIALDWERMAEELQAKESRCGRPDERAPDA